MANMIMGLAIALLLAAIRVELAGIRRALEQTRKQ